MCVSTGQNEVEGVRRPGWIQGVCEVIVSPLQRSQAASPARLGVWAGRPGLFCARPGRTVGDSPALGAYLTGPGRTADICRLSTDKM